MRPSNIKSGYSDNLARQRRVRFLFKAILFLILAVLVLGSIFYLLFFREFMDIKTITLEGLDTLNSNELRDKIIKGLNKKYFGYIPQKNNLYFLNTESLKSEILSQYPILNTLEIKKKMRHELVFRFSERIPAGIWCFYNNDCLYFDSEKNTWGPAAKSSGFLMISVEDERKLDNIEIDNEYFKIVKLLVSDNAKLPFAVKNIIIPENLFRDVKIATAAGYDVLMSLDSNIIEQIEILKLFLDKQNNNFKPQYLDLRIDGRIYYR